MTFNILFFWLYLTTKDDVIRNNRQIQCECNDDSSINFYFQIIRLDLKKSLK